MNTLPAAFEERIKKELGTEASAFLEALQSPSPVSIRLHPWKAQTIEWGEVPGTNGEAVARLKVAGSGYTPVNWCKNGFYLQERPVFTLDPCLHGGAYYVQEASSMFLEHLLRHVLPMTPVRMLDLCAAPGGKSTLAASVLPEGSLLVANEVIRNRAAILKENIIKWGTGNVVVTNNDPADFSPLESVFDLILVDAPCSGEGMFRKDPDAIAEWSEGNVRLCAERQRRILADIWKCLRPGGVLLYSTCTYNRTENEEILEWITRTYSAESIDIPLPFAGITRGESEAHGYHFYPHKTTGEGFFIGALRKTDGREASPDKTKKQKNAKNVSLPEETKEYLLRPEDHTAYESDNILGIIPATHAALITRLDSTLRVLYKGCEVAENNRKLKLLPPLALWQGLNRERCTPYDIDLPTALTFLKKEEIPAPDTPGDWLLVTYRNLPLGWCKHLGNRLNNYYPKEWRIRMQIH